MQKTENLGMNLFESGDPVKAEFFNQNTEILENLVSRKVGFATGSFNGFNKSERLTLSFDSKPLLLLCASSNGVTICIPGSRGITVDCCNNVNVSNTIQCEWGNTSVTLFVGPYESGSNVVNTTGTVNYFAIVA